jgi:hypothetical protein
MKPKLTLFFENMAESATACLLTMVQGNLLALTLGHWLIASRTGLAAGTVTYAALALTRIARPWLISLMLGVATAAADYLVHPRQFGSLITEALMTGLGAAALSWIVGSACRRFRSRRLPGLCRGDPRAGQGAISEEALAPR